MTDVHPGTAKRAIVHPGAVPTGRPYSPALVMGPLVFVSGQLGVDPTTGQVAEGGVAEQTRMAIKNVASLLSEAGLGLSSIGKVTVYLTRQEDFDAMNAVYRELFEEPFPTRSTVIVGLTHPSYLVEVDAIAWRGDAG
jgi:2-iminobutanoate/2-iminopropanoate deaminase